MGTMSCAVRGSDPIRSDPIPLTDSGQPSVPYSVPYLCRTVSLFTAPLLLGGLLTHSLTHSLTRRCHPSASAAQPAPCHALRRIDVAPRRCGGSRRRRPSRRCTQCSTRRPCSTASARSPPTRYVQCCSMLHRYSAPHVSRTSSICMLHVDNSPHGASQSLRRSAAKGGTPMGRVGRCGVALRRGGVARTRLATLSTDRQSRRRDCRGGRRWVRTANR
jgi:hypothetical protein